MVFPFVPLPPAARPPRWLFFLRASGEAALAVYQALPLSSVSAAAGWLVSLSPWLASAFLLQVRVRKNDTATRPVHRLMLCDVRGVQGWLWFGAFRSPWRSGVLRGSVFRGWDSRSCLNFLVSFVGPCVL